MSEHHRRTHHTTASPAIRAKLAAMIAAGAQLACVECGRPVEPGQPWHVAHKLPASQGGRTTLDNCGPAHARCNLSAGGKLGAATVNRRRRAEQDEQQGRRRW